MSIATKLKSLARMAIFAALATNSAADAQGPAPSLIVHLAEGDVQGVVADGVARFLGLPYAAPPVGELRWQPPQPAAPWRPQTLQATRQPKSVLENLLRIGRRAIVSFPNFGFWKMRLQLLIGGHMPRTENLPATWYDTPNIHFCTIKDFVQLCDEINVKMERAVALDLYGRPVPLNLPWWVWNMFGEQGVFLLSRAGKAK